MNFIFTVAQEDFNMLSRRNGFESLLNILFHAVSVGYYN